MGTSEVAERFSSTASGTTGTNWGVISNPVPVAAYWIINISHLPGYKIRRSVGVEVLETDCFQVHLLSGPFILF